MNLHDDNYMMELVKNGDKEAYNALVKKHRISAISFAYSFLSDIGNAEDIVQEVFVNIYLKRETYRPLCEFKTFLFQAVRNKSIDQLRKNKLRKTIDISNISELIHCSPENEFFQTEKVKFVFELVSNLKKDYRTALYLFAVEGASYEEIAKIMNKTMGQVKILIHRARKKVKSQYLEVVGYEK